VALTFRDGTLSAEGAADHGWVERFRMLAPAVAGVEAVDDDRLTDRAAAGFEAARTVIEEMVVVFTFNTAQVRPDQTPKLETLAAKARDLQRYSQALNRPFTLEIVGHTDSTGTERRNATLSRERAQRAREFLIENGLSPDRIQIIGVADKFPVREEKTEADKAMNRSVTFRFIHDAPPAQEQEAPVWP